MTVVTHAQVHSKDSSADGSTFCDDSEAVTDIVARLKSLEQDLARSYEHLQRRIEALESKESQQSQSDHQRRIEALESKESQEFQSDHQRRIEALESKDSQEFQSDHQRRIEALESNTQTPAQANATSHGVRSMSSMSSLSAITSLHAGVKERKFHKVSLGLHKLILDNMPFNKEIKQTFGEEILHHGVHRCIRVSLCSYVGTCMLLFVLWGCVQTCTPMETDGQVSGAVDIENTITAWTEEMQVPKTLCIADLPDGLDVEAFHNSLPHGDESRKTSTKLQLRIRDVPEPLSGSVRKNARCLIDRPSIVGSYGHPLYKYLSFHLVGARNSSVAYPQASLLMNTRLGLQRQLMSPFYDTFYNRIWTGVEVKLDRIVTVRGDILGLSRLVHTYYDDIWQDFDVRVNHVYTRWGPYRTFSPQQQNYATFYLRSSGFQVDNAYRPYDILKLMTDSGGLWIALMKMFIFGTIFFSLCFMLCQRIQQRGVRGFFSVENFVAHELGADHEHKQYTPAGERDDNPKGNVMSEASSADNCKTALVSTDQPRVGSVGIVVHGDEQCATHCNQQDACRGEGKSADAFATENRQLEDL